jgi:phage tail sheath gpL-like
MSNSAGQILSNAVASGSFYKLGLGSATGIAPLLEQKIAVMAEANTDKQTEAALDGGVLKPTTSLEVAEKFGYGSPAHLTAKRLIDDLSILSTVEVKYFFVPESGTGTATSYALNGTGTTVTTTGVLTLNQNGTLIQIGLVKDDTLAEVLVKIKTAINELVNLPVSVPTATPTTTIDIDTKWLGQSSVDVLISIESNTSVGLTFALVKTDGTGEVIPTTELAKFQNDWYVHVLNCLGNGAANAILDEYETFVGTPAAGNGKYSPENMTPLVAWTGTSEDELANLEAVTDSRKAYNVNNYVPVPNAQDIPFMNACSALGLFVLKSNGDPKQDVNLDVFQYTTPPSDSDVGSIIEYSFRNSVVKAGCSTVNFKDEAYYLGDMVTTYHPDGESDPIFRYVRDNMITFNIINQFKAFNDKQKNKTIAPNALPSARITSPALYKAGILNEIIKPFVEAGYIADFDYAKANLDVGINPSNSGRFDVLSPNLITSLLRIVATEVQVNKFYGE